MDLSKLFEDDVAEIYGSLDIGKYPVLTKEETDAVNQYPMKWKGPMTPLLRY